MPSIPRPKPRSNLQGTDILEALDGHGFTISLLLIEVHGLHDALDDKVDKQDAEKEQDNLQNDLD